MNTTKFSNKHTAARNKLVSRLLDQGYELGWYVVYEPHRIYSVVYWW